ncbi:hypothetical protein [Halosolutus gelatinilyticus]|uniref:hypothetical protein n=1 Tax=Halosolutus gelatinilyticus TaxID=2931975 RepID=UPI001FF103D2|nr:hypothetical protein [Halosolutus gelatinilyticus]
MRRDPPRSTGLTSASTRLAIAFVALVGLSGGTIALQGGASLLVAGVAAIGGLLAGGALLWYLYWIA